MEKEAYINIILEHYSDCSQIQEGDTYSAAKSCLDALLDAGILLPNEHKDKKDHINYFI